MGERVLGALTFLDDGTVGAIYTDEAAEYLRDLSPTGSVEVRRASDVEPAGDGWVAAMRVWVPGGAVALPAAATRAEALAAEARYLESVL